tara:strand:+ start:694 stop:831 length:138 start_codon:yes stop_codon:yes gene_type:complete
MERSLLPLDLPTVLAEEVALTFEPAAGSPVGCLTVFTVAGNVFDE